MRCVELDKNGTRIDLPGSNKSNMYLIITPMELFNDCIYGASLWSGGWIHPSIQLMDDSSSLCRVVNRRWRASFRQVRE